MKKIDWLIIARKTYYYYWFIDNATEWIRELDTPPRIIEQRYLRIHSKKQRDQALLLISLGLTKAEIEDQLGTNNGL